MSERKSADMHIIMPRHYADELERIARKTGQTKSELVREWIKFFGNVDAPGDDADLAGEGEA